MRKTNNTFIPSAVLDDIYDYLTDKVFIASNEDIYYRDIVRDIPDILDGHDDVLTTSWEEYYFPGDETGLLIVSWQERKGRLIHLEHFRFTKNYEEDFFNE